MYSAGICGAQEFTLDAGGAPSFLTSSYTGSLTFDTWYKIIFDSSIPVLADCQTYSIPYTIRFVDYPSNDAYTGTFDLHLVDRYVECIGVYINSKVITESAVWHVDDAGRTFSNDYWYDSVDKSRYA